MCATRDDPNAAADPPSTSRPRQRKEARRAPKRRHIGPGFSLATMPPPPKSRPPSQKYVALARSLRQSGPSAWVGPGVGGNAVVPADTVFAANYCCGRTDCCSDSCCAWSNPRAVFPHQCTNSICPTRGAGLCFMCCAAPTWPWPPLLLGPMERMCFSCAQLCNPGKELGRFATAGEWHDAMAEVQKNPDLPAALSGTWHMEANPCAEELAMLSGSEWDAETLTLRNDHAFVSPIWPVSRAPPTSLRLAELTRIQLSPSSHSSPLRRFAATRSVRSSCA